MMSGKLQNLKSGVMKTAKRALAIALYLWVLLSLFAIHKALLMGDENLLYQIGFAFVNASALAKAVLIGEDLHIGESPKNRPRAYAIIYKAAAFSLILFFFRMIEETVLGMLHGKSFAASLASSGSILGDAKLLGIFLVCTIMFFALIPFFAYLEIEDAVGTRELRSILFGGSSDAADLTRNAQREDHEKSETSPASNEGRAPIDYWYYEKGGAVVGPFTVDEMYRLVKNHEIEAKTLVCNVTAGGAWQELSETFFM